MQFGDDPLVKVSNTSLILTDLFIPFYFRMDLTVSGGNLILYLLLAKSQNQKRRVNIRE